MDEMVSITASLAARTSPAIVAIQVAGLFSIQRRERRSQNLEGLGSITEAKEQPIFRPIQLEYSVVIKLLLL
jgi:hypothetical protein